jgi:hypothetical protein
MELPGTGYLLALAALAIAFIGFASLVIIFLRPATGGPLTRYDAFFTLSFVQLGFIITFGSLLPPLLSLYRLPEAVVWGWASGISTVPFALFLVATPIRRRLAVGSPPPTYFHLVNSVHGIALLALVLTASGVAGEYRAAVYATAMTLILIASALAYLLALRILLLADPKSSPRK